MPRGPSRRRGSVWLLSGRRLLARDEDSVLLVSVTSKRPCAKPIRKAPRQVVLRSGNGLATGLRPIGPPALSNVGRGRRGHAAARQQRKTVSSALPIRGALGGVPPRALYRVGDVPPLARTRITLFGALRFAAHRRELTAPPRHAPELLAGGTTGARERCAAARPERADCGQLSFVP